LIVKIFGETVLSRFAKRHADSRTPLVRFLAVARNANWEHIPALKETLGSADLGKRTGKLIVDIGGNKYRLIAIINFETQELNIERILTHEEYNREGL
jgi:mRNA interferase HigB